ncbi:hypothetical protein PCH_Pc22g22760 [Penicillium rubens Wisconsin 54-1255]|uniref:Uncharacterized protein n=1 Tax=Penicillium rubens (strain ATCC 28089 / DSM 1075 / NRRL 1951 / Wisconsin 54-1255) TaxID=500485 RepID=B6HUP8_PENRW|nr:hypothetical protein PCH_Pc22g22760 [Penicillium rubens Wisconsin 54-1255]
MVMDVFENHAEGHQEGGNFSHWGNSGFCSNSHANGPEARRGQFFSSPRNPTDSRPLWISGCMGPDSEKYYEDQTFLTLNKLFIHTPQVYTSMYQYPGIFVAQLPQSTIRIGYLVSSDMGLLKEPTVGSGFRGCDVIDFPTAHVFNQFRYQLSDNQLRYEEKAKRLQSF